MTFTGIRDVRGEKGWKDGRFILWAMNTNRVYPGQLLVLTFKIVDSGSTTLKWNEIRTNFAPAETNDILVETPLELDL